MHLPDTFTLLVIVVIYNESVTNDEAIYKRQISYIHLVAVTN